MAHQCSKRTSSEKSHASEIEIVWLKNLSEHLQLVGLLCGPTVNGFEHTVRAKIENWASLFLHNCQCYHG